MPLGLALAASFIAARPSAARPTAPTPRTHPQRARLRSGDVPGLAAAYRRGREALGDDLGDAGVKLLAAALEEALIGGVLDGKCLKA